MTEKNNPEIIFTESPASWNTKYLDPNGFICQLTLRSDTGKELLEKVSGALIHLMDNGCTPYNYTQNGGSKKTAWCSIHQAEMKMFSKDNGSSWYSHKLPDGSWCYGKTKNENGG